MVCSQVPVEVAVWGLGSYRLKGVTELMRVVQVLPVALERRMDHLPRGALNRVSLCGFVVACVCVGVNPTGLCQLLNLGLCAGCASMWHFNQLICCGIPATHAITCCSCAKTSQLHLVPTCQCYPALLHHVVHPNSSCTHPHTQPW